MDRIRESFVAQSLEDLRQVYLGFGIDLADYHGDDGWELPLSTRLVVRSLG